MWCLNKFVVWKYDITREALEAECS